MKGYVAQKGDRWYAVIYEGLAGYGHVEVHCMPERFGGIELLHPDSGSVAEGVDGGVIRLRRVAEHRLPEAKVDRVGLCCDGQLHLLHCAAIGTGAMAARDCRHSPGSLDGLRCELPEVAGEPHGEAVGGDRHKDAISYCRDPS